MKDVSEPERYTRKLDDAGRRELVRITARGFFDEMVDYGFDDGDIINFTTEILDLLIQRDRTVPPPPAPAPPAYTIDYRQDSDGRVTGIVGPQLALSPLGESDGPVLEKWRGEAAYRGTLIEHIFHSDLEDTLKDYGSDRGRFFLVRLEGQHPIGFLTYKLSPSDPSRAEMQKFVAEKQQRGRGYGLQMTYLWLHYGFTRLDLRKITARMVDSNLANINLNRKLGFRFEGHLREEVRLGDSLVDITLMSVLRRNAEPLLGIARDPSGEGP